MKKASIFIFINLIILYTYYALEKDKLNNEDLLFNSYLVNIVNNDKDKKEFIIFLDKVYPNIEFDNACIVASPTIPRIFKEVIKIDPYGTNLMKWLFTDNYHTLLLSKHGKLVLGQAISNGIDPYVYVGLPIAECSKSKILMLTQGSRSTAPYFLSFKE